VNPTPKLISSISGSPIASSRIAATGGSARSVSSESAVKAQPFLYFSAKALDSVIVLVRETTAVLRSKGFESF
jgi:hypothetical protein